MKQPLHQIGKYLNWLSSYLSKKLLKEKFDKLNIEEISKFIKSKYNIIF